MLAFLDRPGFLVVALLALVIFGAKRLPDSARSLGRSMRILKAETKGLHDDGTPVAPVAPALPVAPPVPVAAPVAAPVATPVAAPVAAPVATPVATPVAAPVAGLTAEQAGVNGQHAVADRL